MKYSFKVKKIDMSTGGKNIAVFNKEDAEDLDLENLERVKIHVGKKSCTAIVDLTDTMVKPGEIGTLNELTGYFNLKAGQKVSITRTRKPESIRYIRKKMDKHELSQIEFDAIIKDVMHNDLTDVELASFVAACYMGGLSDDETVFLTNSIVDSGKTLELNKKPILDKHCAGGVPGNKTTMIIVPIVAAAGFTIPKTSSRAITSPAGTADAMEVLCPVNLSRKKTRKIVKQIGGCIVWGGGVELAAADDKLIRVRHPLRLDPQGMLLASILAKKKAAGATHVLIDLPIGKGAKFEGKNEAKQIASRFMHIGRRLGMQVKCILTPGYDAIGFAIGPALEAREVLRILEGEGVSYDLREKALTMAGLILELGGLKKGYEKASEILNSGDALEKMQEIIKAQGGSPVNSTDIKVGKYTYDYLAPKSGRVYYTNTKNLSAIARIAGAPKDKKAGLYTYIEKGDKVYKGQKVMTIFAESKFKLQGAIEALKNYPPVEFEKIILDKFYTDKDFIVMK